MNSTRICFKSSLKLSMVGMAVVLIWSLFQLDLIYLTLWSHHQLFKAKMDLEQFLLEVDLNLVSIPMKIPNWLLHFVFPWKSKELVKKLKMLPEEVLLPLQSKAKPKNQKLRQVVEVPKRTLFWPELWQCPLANLEVVTRMMSILML